MINTQPQGDFEQLNVDSRLMDIFKSLIIPLGCSLPNSSEVVLHDLGKLPNSIVAIYGNATGRSVGDPATDRLLRSFASNDFRTVVGYQTELSDGRQLKSSTIILNNLEGIPIAALCINSDVSVWYQVQKIAESMTNSGLLQDSSADEPVPNYPTQSADTSDSPVEQDGELFVRDVDELAHHLITDAIESSGVPVSLMKKSHKIEVVRTLRKCGVFLLKDAVDMVAEALEVSRFTVYNYVNEIEAAEQT